MAYRGVCGGGKVGHRKTKKPHLSHASRLPHFSSTQILRRFVVIPYQALACMDEGGSW